MKKILVISMLAYGALFTASCNKKCDDFRNKNNTDCVDKSKATNQPCNTLRYDPVCGCNGVTYPSPCDAENAGVLRYVYGECSSGKQ